MICPHCSKTIEDGTSFCQYCGKEIGDNKKTADSIPTYKEKKIRCPHCHKAELKSHAETTGKSILNMNGSGKSKVYLTCQSCNTKFREPNNLDAEFKPKAISLVIQTLISAIVWLFLLNSDYYAKLTKLARNNGKAETTVIVILAIIVIDLLYICYQAYKIAKIQQERVYLKSNCIEQ